MNRTLRRYLARAVWALAAAFLVAPVLLVVWLGLSDARTISVSEGHASLASVRTFLEDQSWTDALRRSLLLAAAVAVLAVALGSLAAYVNVRQSAMARTISGVLMVVPSVVPTVVYALGLVLLSARVTVDPVVLIGLGHTILATPFAFMVMRVGMQALRADLIESARLLGASWTTTLTLVVVPPLVPYALVSAALVGSVSLAEPVMAIFLLNDSSATLPQKSFQGLRFAFDPAIMTAAATIIVLTLVVTVPCLALLMRREHDD